MPLRFSHPSLAQGARRERLVNLIDILPTMLEFAGIEVPGSIEGVTRTNELAGQDAFDGMAVSDFYSFGIPERMIRTPRYKYMYSGAPDDEGGGAQLYDLKTDPHETTNLAADASHEPTRRKLHGRLIASWGSGPERWRLIQAAMKD